MSEADMMGDTIFEADGPKARQEFKDKLNDHLLKLGEGNINTAELHKNIPETLIEMTENILQHPFRNKLWFYDTLIRYLEDQEEADLKGLFAQSVAINEDCKVVCWKKHGRIYR